MVPFSLLRGLLFQQSGVNVSLLFIYFSFGQMLAGYKEYIYYLLPSSCSFVETIVTVIYINHIVYSCLWWLWQTLVLSSFVSEAMVSRDSFFLEECLPQSVSWYLLSTFEKLSPENFEWSNFWWSISGLLLFVCCDSSKNVSAQKTIERKW